MATSVKQMMEAANAAVPRITPAQAREMIAKGNTLVVDVRDAPEVEKSGKAAGAVHVSRGMLEFRADPGVAIPRQEFRQGQDRDPLLRLGRPLGLGRQGAQGHGLRARLQPRRLQGLGRRRWRGRQAGRTGRVNAREPRAACTSSRSNISRGPV